MARAARTKFAVVFTCVETDLTSAEKKQVKDGLTDKVSKLLKIAGFEMKPSAVRIERPQVAPEADEAPVRGRRAPKVEEDEAPVRSRRAPKVEEDEAPVRGRRAPKVEEDEAPVRGRRAPKVVEEDEAPVRGRRAPKVEEDEAPVRGRRAPKVEEDEAPVRRTKKVLAEAPARRIPKPKHVAMDLDDEEDFED